jgi:hypothetical protein
LTIAIGYSTVAASIGTMIAVLHFAGATTSAFVLVPSIYLIGAGQGFVNSPLFAVALARVRRGQEGSASGLITTFQQTGASIGVALEGLVFFSALGAAAGSIRIAPVLASSALQRALWVNLALDVVAALCVRLLPAGRQILSTRGMADPTGLEAPGAPGRPSEVEMPASAEPAIVH